MKPSTLWDLIIHFKLNQFKTITQVQTSFYKTKSKEKLFTLENIDTQVSMKMY